MSSNPFFLSFVLVGGFVSTVAVTFLLARLGVRKGVVDIPNDRSSHSASTPRGGGVAIVLSFFIFLYFYPILFSGYIDASLLKSLFVGGAVIAVIGVFDDLNHIPARWRFFVQLSAALLSLYLLPMLPEIPLLGFNLDLGLFGYVFFAIALVWYVNLFNFMDGIDGIAGIEAITVLSSGMLILFLQGDNAWLIVFGYLVVCIAGFLVWNWSPAKVFMGDACSGFLGFTLGLIALITSLSGHINLWAWMILFGVFLIDATTTLIRRIGRGDKWYEAHRSHAYQILSRRFASHQKVTIGVLVINLIWLLPLAYLAAIFPSWGLVLCCGALLPLLLLALRVGAGTKETE